MNDIQENYIDAQPTKVEKFKRRKLRKRRLGLFGIVLISVIVIAVSVFNIPRIDSYIISGTDKLNKAIILENSNTRDKVHIFKLDYDKIKAGIESDPYFKVESIEYKFPASIEISVKERTKDASIRHFNDDIIISKDGTVLEYANAGSYPDVFRLLGLSMTGYSVGEKLGVADDYQMMVTLKILEALYAEDYYLDYRLLHVSNPVDVKLLSNNGVTVRIGNIENLEYKLFVSSKQLRTNLRENGGGVLDASTDAVTYRTSTVGSIEIPTEFGQESDIYIGDYTEIVDSQDISGIIERNVEPDTGVESSSGVTNDSPPAGNNSEPAEVFEDLDSEGVASPESQEDINPFEDLAQEGQDSVDDLDDDLDDLDLE